MEYIFGGYGSRRIFPIHFDYTMQINFLYKMCSKLKYLQRLEQILQQLGSNARLLYRRVLPLTEDQLLENKGRELAKFMPDEPNEYLQLHLKLGARSLTLSFYSKSNHIDRWDRRGSAPRHGPSTQDDVPADQDRRVVPRYRRGGASTRTGQPDGAVLRARASVQGEAVPQAVARHGSGATAWRGRHPRRRACDGVF